MKKAILSVVLLLLAIGMQAQQVAPFKAGDRVTFVGDSKTDGGHYHSYIWLYYMTHYPTMRLWMANCGVGGDTSEDIYNRFDDDVLTKHPTVMTLAFGMNDTGYGEYNGPEPAKFAAKRLAFAHENFEKIIGKLKKLNGVRIVMLGTAPYDQTSKFNDNIFKGKNDVIGKVVAMQDSAAKANRWEFVDFWKPMTDINLTMQKTDPKFTICGQDRIHPDNDGQLVMAYLFLKAQGKAGEKVAGIGIDAKKCIVTNSDNCTISDLVTGKGALSFNYLAKSLPFPLDTIPRGWEYKRQQKAALKVIPQFMEEMDNEELCVTGLKKGNYCVKIDDTVIDTLSNTALAKGINLANYNYTPQYLQAKTIMELNEMRWETERQFRDYAWLQYDFFMKHGMLNKNDEAAAKMFRIGEAQNGWVKARMGLYDKMIHKECRDLMNKNMENLVDKIYQINKPVSHKISITAIK